MACPALIVFTGAVANFKDNRQLTYWEAWTCGLAYWFWLPGRSASPPTGRLITPSWSHHKSAVPPSSADPKIAMNTRRRMRTLSCSPGIVTGKNGLQKR
jgi:hypothetical protein